MAKSKKLVPEILWKLFKNRARTLADTIIALLPSPPSPAERCINHRQCIGCIRRDKVMSFLLRSKDPPEYQKLLTKCFVVVSEDAPPFTQRHRLSCWSQLEVVMKTTELVISENPKSCNILCSGYDKKQGTSAVLDLLTSPVWELLLKRVGVFLMVYLLQNTSIFLPLTRQQHHQVTGFPLTDTEMFSNCKRSLIGKKRKRNNESSISTSNTCAGCNCNNYPTQSNVKQNIPINNEIYALKNSNESSNQSIASPKKRVRESKHKRLKKRRQLILQGTYSLQNSSENSNSHKKTTCCSCCSIFKNLPKVVEGKQINRRIIFHKLENCSLMFPRKHILNSITRRNKKKKKNSEKTNPSRAKVLFKDIFGYVAPTYLHCSHSKICHEKTKCLYHSLMKMLKQLNNNVKRCKLLKLLNKHCDIPLIDEDTGFTSKSFCSQEQVTEFIWAVCKSIIPRYLLVSPPNLNIIKKSISRVVRLRRYEDFSLEQCMYGFKTTSFLFLSNKHLTCVLEDDSKDRKLDVTDLIKGKLVKCWIYWVFSSLVLPLIQANFYVTESDHGKNEVFYYRKAVWKELTSKADICLNSQSYNEIDFKSVFNIIKKRSFGFSKVRLCPKNEGVRVISSLNLKSKLRVNRMKRTFKSVNSVLQDAHTVLKNIQMRKPEELGSSVFDYNDVYKKLIAFVLSLKRGHIKKIPKLFIIVSDVSKAFDSINQNKMLEIVKDLISDKEYTFKRLVNVECSEKSMWSHTRYLELDKQSISANSLHTILVKQTHVKIETRRVLNDIEEYIKNNLIKMGPTFYKQSVGIPQGGKVSSLLCSFYYGNLDNTVLYPYLEKACKIYGEQETAKYLLLRLIDDYLFISTSKKQACAFYSRMKRGSGGYNCNMNQEKFGVNFDINDSSKSQAKRVSIGNESASFLKWTGLLVNCSTLEIQADYTRYLDSHLSRTLTVNWKDKTKCVLKNKLRTYLQPKCHPVFYDSNLNSPSIVRLNIYQAFVICAMKFHCYVALLSSTSKFDTSSVKHILFSSLRYMHNLIKKRMYSMKVGFDYRPLLKLKKWETEWLGLVAYIRVLDKKQSRYKEVLCSLRSELRRRQKEETISEALKYAVDDSNSAILWQIKY